MIKQAGNEWIDEGKQKFGSSLMQWRFKCPSCGHVSSGQDFIDAGARSLDACVECIGVVNGKGEDGVKGEDKGFGCNWTAYGDAGTLGKGRLIDTADGSVIEVFDFADTESEKNKDPQEEISIMNNYITMIIEPVREGVILPEYNDEEDACMDVFVNLPDPSKYIRIEPGETKLVPLGFKLGIPQDWFVSLRPRSGISLKTQLRIANTPGTIDTNFKGELGALVSNISIPDKSFHYLNINACIMKDGKWREEPEKNINGCYIIRHGDKIAQILPERRYKLNLVPGKADDVGSDRGGGCGSSGTRTKEEL